MPCTFYRNGQLALMISAGPCHTPGNNLSPLRDIFASLELFNVLIVNGFGLIHTECADFSPGFLNVPDWSLRSLFSIVFHQSYLLFH